MLFNPTPITADELAAGLAVTVITTVVITTTVATPSAPVVVAGAGVVRGAEDVSPAVVTLDTVEEGERLGATPAEVVEVPKVLTGEDAPEELAKPLVVVFDVALTAVVLAMLVVKVPLATVGVVPLVVGLPNPNVATYDEPN